MNINIHNRLLKFHAKAKRINIQDIYDEPPGNLSHNNSKKMGIIKYYFHDETSKQYRHKNYIVIGYENGFTKEQMENMTELDNSEKREGKIASEGVGIKYFIMPYSKKITILTYDKTNERYSKCCKKTYKYNLLIQKLETLKNNTDKTTNTNTDLDKYISEEEEDTIDEFECEALSGNIEYFYNQLKNDYK